MTTCDRVTGERRVEQAAAADDTASAMLNKNKNDEAAADVAGSYSVITTTTTTAIMEDPSLLSSKLNGSSSTNDDLQFHDEQQFSNNQELNDVLRVLACLYPRKICTEMIGPVFKFPLEPYLALAVESKVIVAIKVEVSSEEIASAETAEKKDRHDSDQIMNSKDEANASSSLSKSRTAHYLYSFPSESAWKSVYHRLIPENEREKAHLELGRRLWKNLDVNYLESCSLAADDEHRNDAIDIILSQIMKGRRYIKRDKEIDAIRSLCLNAGKNAAQNTSDFSRAAEYLNFGISLLDDEQRAWQKDEYALTLALHNAAAEMEMCMGRCEKMDALIDKVMEHANTFLDKRQSYTTRILGFSASRRHAEALETGFTVLHGLGEKRFPPPKRLQLFHIAYHFWGIKRQFEKKSNGQLLRLPHLQDESIFHVMQILNVLVFPSEMYNIPIGLLVSLRMMRLTLDHGLSALSPVAFSLFGILSTALGYFDLGRRCASISLELLERYQVQEYLPRVYCNVYGGIYRFLGPPRENIEPLREAFRVGMRTGDLEFAGVAKAMSFVMALEAGDSLDALLAEFSLFEDLLHSKRQEAQIQMMRPFIQGLHHLMGLSNDPTSPQGDLMNYDEARQLAEQSGGVNITGKIITMWQIRLAYIFNEYESAAAFADGQIYDAFRIDPTFGLMCTLVSTAMLQQPGRRRRDRRKHWRLAKFGLKKLRQYAAVSPYDSSGKLCLVKAEIASVQGDNGRAMLHYVMAISLTQQVNNTFEYALANERAARHILGTGDASGALRYFQTALEAYTTWGANAKVDRLHSELETIYNDTAASINHPKTTTTTTTMTSPSPPLTR